MTFYRNPFKAWNLETSGSFPHAPHPEQLGHLVGANFLTAPQRAGPPHLYSEGLRAALHLSLRPNPKSSVFTGLQFHTFQSVHRTAVNFLKRKPDAVTHLLLPMQKHTASSGWSPNSAGIQVAPSGATARPCHLARLGLSLLPPGTRLPGPPDDVRSLGRAPGQRTLAGAILRVWRAGIFLFSSKFNPEVIPSAKAPPVPSPIRSDSFRSMYSVQAPATAHHTVPQWLLSAHAPWKHGLQFHRVPGVS